MAKRTRPTETATPENGAAETERQEHGAPLAMDQADASLPPETPPEAEPPSDPAPQAPPVEDPAPADPASDPEPRPESPIPLDPPAPAVTSTAPRSGFAGMVLGGVLAAGLGYALATFVPVLPEPAAAPRISPELEAQLAALSDRVAALEPLAAQGQALADRLALLETADPPPAPPTVDLSPVQAGLSALESRLAAIEALPVEGNTAGSAALLARIDALSSELAALKTEGAMARSTIEAMAADAEARRAAAEAEAEALRAHAQAAAAKTLRDAALGQIHAAMETGAPFAAPLAGLGLAEVPEPLSSVAETGVPTLAALIEDFPPAARAALSAARHATTGGDLTQRLTSFLETATGARSLAPREGSDPDAILSRAEAALRGGDLSAALAEIAALPPEGQAELAEWSARATARINALAAVAALPE